MKKYLLTTLFFSFGCGILEPKYDLMSEEVSVCDESLKDKVAQNVLSCIKNANPKSDEEPEDWLNICKDMMKDVFCESKFRHYVWERGGHQKYYCDDDKIPLHIKDVCDQKPQAELNQ